MTFEPVMPPYNASDPTARFLSASCLDFLFIELVPMAYRVTNELEAVAREQEMLADGFVGNENDGTASATNVDGPGTGTGTTVPPAATATTGGSSAGVLGAGGSSRGGGAGGQGSATVAMMDEEEERQAVFRRLEGIGYRVGQGLAERCVGLPSSRNATGVG
jgi:hypothetical protein